MSWGLERTLYFNDSNMLIFSHFNISDIGMKFIIHDVLQLLLVAFFVCSFLIFPVGLIISVSVPKVAIF